MIFALRKLLLQDLHYKVINVYKSFIELRVITLAQDFYKCVCGIIRNNFVGFPGELSVYKFQSTRIFSWGEPV